MRFTRRLGARLAGGPGAPGRSSSSEGVSAMTSAAQGQNTVPGQLIAAQVFGAVRSPWAAKPARRRRAAKRASPSSSSRKRKRSGKPARLVKGSAAAKRYMASIRRKRKR